MVVISSIFVLFLCNRDAVGAELTLTPAAAPTHFPMNVDVPTVADGFQHNRENGLARDSRVRRDVNQVGMGFLYFFGGKGANFAYLCENGKKRSILFSRLCTLRAGIVTKYTFPDLSPGPPCGACAPSSGAWLLSIRPTFEFRFSIISLSLFCPFSRRNFDITGNPEKGKKRKYTRRFFLRNPRLFGTRKLKLALAM